jgi:hypothetical protein
MHDDILDPPSHDGTSVDSATTVHVIDEGIAIPHETPFPCIQLRLCERYLDFVVMTAEFPVGEAQAALGCLLFSSRVGLACLPVR